MPGYVPEPSQRDWDGSGSMVYAYAPEYAVPVEWVARGTDPLSGGIVRTMRDGFVTPDRLYTYERLGWTSTDDGPAPHAEQLDLAPGDLAGDVVVLGEYNWQDTALVAPAGQTLGHADPIMGTQRRWAPDTWTSGDSEEREWIDGNWYRHMLPGYLTPGQLYVWQLTADDDEPDPDPDPPDDDTADTVARVVAFAGLDPEDDEARAVIAAHVPIVTAQVRAYTRGRGFSEEDDGPGGDVLAVIVSACARSATNPTGAARLSFGELRHEPGTFDGFTLGELAILNPYRKRWT